jgi:hypothetical protein
VEFSAFQEPKDLLFKWQLWTSCVDWKQLTFGSSTPLCAKYIGATWLYIKTRGVCHTVALPFTFKSILMQKKNYENSNISPC